MRLGAAVIGTASEAKGDIKMDGKQALTQEQLEMITGGTAEYGTEINGKTDDQTKKLPERQANHPVYCTECHRLIGYSIYSGTIAFYCSDCKKYSC